MKNIRVSISLLVLLIAAFLGLGVRCFYLQLIEGDRYLSLCDRQLGRIAQKAQRGPILDCRGNILAASNKIQTIFAEPREIKDRQAVSVNLAPIVKMGARRIYEIITQSKNQGFAKILVGANQQQCQKAGKIYGIGIESDWQRHYPTGNLASTVVGFTSGDNRGLAGIELRFDEQLAGSQGSEIFMADIHRRPVKLKRQASYLIDGVGIILTLDSTIQQFARSELLKQFQIYQAESAIAIVAEPKTGAILAMVSLPDFDPNQHRFADPNTFRNRSISDQFEPGSILKPIAIAIALDAGVIDKNEKIFCEYGNYHGKGFGRIGEYGDHQFGDLSIKQILIHSSNIGMAKIGQKLGKESLYKGLQLFGFGKKTDIDIPGETGGLLRPPQLWTGYSVTRIPFGQEITVTAIQLVRAFCILANGGRTVKPFVVKAVVANDGQIVKLKHPTPSVGYVIKPEVAEWIVTEALTEVVNSGTEKRAKLEKWQVFGKTGTANIAKSDSKGYSDDDYVASFIAGAPAEEPAVIVLVSIRKPNKKLGYTGGTVAAPVAAKIIEKTLTYLEK